MLRAPTAGRASGVACHRQNELRKLSLKQKFLLAAVLATLAGAALIGAGYGWIAVRTGSVTPVLVPHAIADASGVRPVSRLWLGRPDS